MRMHRASLGRLLVLICLPFAREGAAACPEHVVNGGFEAYGACPAEGNGNHHASLATGWTGNHATEGADYYHADCPYRHWSGVVPRGGSDGCVGIALGGQSTSYSEIIQQSVSLQAGKTYDFSMHAKVRTGPAAGYEFGFEIDPPGSGSSTYIVESQLGGTWTEIAGRYTAAVTGSHEITIGHPLALGPSPVPPTYVVVDDVSITDACDPAVPTLVVQDVACPGEVVWADGSLSENETSHVWSILSFATDGSMIGLAGGAYPGPAGPIDLSALLDAHGAEFEPGRCYVIDLTVKNCCTAGGATATEVMCIDDPVADAGPDKFACPGTGPPFLSLGTASLPGYAYSWSPSNYLVWPSSATPWLWTQPVFTTTHYTVTATSPHGCVATDTVTVTVGANAGRAVRLPPYLLLCGITPVKLKVIGTSGVSVEWEYSTDGVNWLFAPGSTGALTYNFGPITETTHFRARVRCDVPGHFASLVSNEVVASCADEATERPRPGGPPFPPPPPPDHARPRRR